MAKDRLARLAVALVFSGFAVLVTNLIYSERDQLVEWEWARAKGKFAASPDERLQIIARNFAEAKNTGQACVEIWLGKDDQYLYLALGCARFEEKLGEVKALDGNPNFLATRMRYIGDKVQSMEQPNRRAYQNGIRRLFPIEAAEKLRNTSSLPEFHQRGIARMAEIRSK